MKWRTIKEEQARDVWASGFFHRDWVGYNMRGYIAEDENRRTGGTFGYRLVQSTKKPWKLLVWSSEDLKFRPISGVPLFDELEDAKRYAEVMIKLGEI